MRMRTPLDEMLRHDDLGPSGSPRKCSFWFKGFRRTHRCVFGPLGRKSGGNINVILCSRAQIPKAAFIASSAALRHLGGERRHCAEECK